MRGQLVAAAVATIVALAIGEVVIRIMRGPPGYVPIIHQEDSLYTPHPARGYTLRPGAHHQYVTPEVNVAMDVSSDGLRDTTVTAARQADYRVLAVGNSFTMGLAVELRDTWSKQLEHLFAERQPSRTVHVLDAGVAGYSPRQIRLRMEELIPLFRPHVVVFEFTTQTFGRMFHPNVPFDGTLARTDVLPGLRMTSGGLLYTPYRTVWLRNLDYWMNQHFQLGAHVLRRASLILGTIPRESPDELNETDPQRINAMMQPALEELSQAHRFSVAHAVSFIVLFANPQRPEGSYSPLERIYNDVVAERCQAEGISYIDLLPTLVRESHGRPVFRTAHDQHWTPAAHALAARTLLDSISHRGP
jgi:hypothetical protein